MDRGGRAAAWWAGIAAAGIAYGTLIPFRFRLDPGFLRAHWDWLRATGTDIPNSVISITDVIQNIILFLPFGLALAWARGRRGPGSVLAAAGAGAALSLAVETLQLAMPDRVSSWSDLAANTVGAALGAACLPLARALSGRLRRTPAYAALLATQEGRAALWAAVLMALLEWLPFDFSLDWGGVKNKLKILLGRQPYPEGPMAMAIHAAPLLLACLAGGFAWTAWARRRLPAALAAVAGALAAAAWGMGLEASQLIVASRMPEPEVMGLAALAAGLGAVAALAPGFRAPAVRAWALVVLAAAAVTVTGLYPFTPAPVCGDFQWIPWYSDYLRAGWGAFGDLGEKLLVCAPAGYALAGWARAGRGRTLAWLAALVPVAALAVAEWVQRCLPGRFGSLGDILNGCLGLALGAWLRSRGPRGIPAPETAGPGI